MPDDPGRAHFEATLLPHLDAAYNLARYLLRDDADALDVAQEATLRALRYFTTLRGQETLPWFLRIVRNTAFTFLERRHAHEAESIGEDAMIPDTSTPDPAAKLATDIDTQRLQEAVEALPPEFREVIVLRELEGLSYKQIAAATDTSIGTVMSRISRARKRLQLALASDNPNAPQESDHGV